MIDIIAFYTANRLNINTIDVDDAYTSEYSLDGSIDVNVLYAENSPKIELVSSDIGGAITALAAAQEAENFRNETEAFRDEALISRNETEVFRNDSEQFSIQTSADRVQTGLDRIQTESDAQATAADRVQTGLDRTQTESDAQATAADRVQTGLDAQATAADRIQTGLDRIQTGLDAQATAADRIAISENRDIVAAYVEDVDNLVTKPFAEFAASLIKIQAIVAERYGFD